MRGFAAVGLAALVLTGCQSPGFGGAGSTSTCRSALTGDVYTIHGRGCSGNDIPVPAGTPGKPLGNERPVSIGTPNASNPAAAKKPWKERRVPMTPALEKAIQEAVRNDLKDPESARFKITFAFKEDDGSIAGCGMVNAKNAYGGYVGFEPFRAFVANSKGKYVGAGAIFGGGKYPGTFYELHPMCDPRNW